MKMNYLYLFIILLLLGCDMHRSENARSMNEVDEPIDSLMKKIIEYGDTNSYYDLKISSLEDSIDDDVFRCAIIMAEKYHYLPAYYDVYSMLSPSSLFRITAATIDTNGKSLALKYVIESFDKKLQLNHNTLDSLNLLAQRTPDISYIKRSR